MSPSQPVRQPTSGKALKIGIVDLIEKQPADTLYARMLNPNFASIMPQVIAVWAEQMGHEVNYVTYTGLEDLRRELPRDVDVLFVCAFTQAAYLAYSISNLFRKENVVTVLGGPHARAYAEDARDYFDYVIGLADRELIHDLLQDPSPNPREGVLLSARQQPETLPGVRERWKFIRKNLDKTWVIHVVQMIGSLGCPYTCSFCIDSQVDYQTLPYDQIREDLAFLQGQPSPPKVSWFDPNFGVRFDDYMEVIESSVRPGALEFACESSLSLLSEPHLKRMKENNFIVVLPGIESWFGFNGKSKQRNNTGMEKVRAVAEHVNLVMRHIPYIQTNFIFGLDSDVGPEPFELTKRFLDLAPGVYPNYSLLTAFGNSAPLNRQYQAEGRVIDVPFPFLDGYSALNIRLKNYSNVEFFGHMIDLMQYTLSARLIWRRFRANSSSLARWMNLIRAVSSQKSGAGKYVEVRNRLTTDREFQAFHVGEGAKPPSFYVDRIRSGLGPFYDHLPAKVMDYLKRGGPAQNPRLTNALTGQRKEESLEASERTL
ncbi:MAG: hypothetical protein A3F84_27665 [Candidatus Handelsmanbacteria bacterium RIFCSPLOWO2_12_FULL_64_10]|uniref:Radical SAM protein n=1 Tax=Handelsmanbacteria sp. (strain RIFCSPLOWO2_12_FULL_64_10) TaxID=1817868 RepID=A0A1F6CH58_HANXR|nr:MAG: hypothetical protein A3F84_27665 [Candidatus Handelsmanbacteria bacterium RIFCSPLOWO2_12_FULL_64_10]